MSQAGGAAVSGGDAVSRVGGAAAGHVLRVEGLRAGIPGREILNGIDLEVRSGEVHAVMGPNGSGKSTLSHVLMGRPGYEVLGGSVTLDGQELLGLEPWRRARAGLFLALQYPIEVPGVSLVDALQAALGGDGGDGDGGGHGAGGGDRAGVPVLLDAEADGIGFDRRFLTRSLNVDLSGGEKKRNETLQLAVLRPHFAILDEIDSGLDIDALRAVARRVEAASRDSGESEAGTPPGWGLGVLAITHYNRLLKELRPDVVHVLTGGRIVASGGPDLAEELEQTGYLAYDGTEVE